MFIINLFFYIWMDLYGSMPLKKLFLTGVFLYAAGIAGAQNISMEETLAYINGKLSGNYTVEVKRGVLLVASFKDEKKMMDETIGVTDLTAKVDYAEDEKALIMKCADGDKCVQREEYLVKKKNYFSRLKIVPPQDERSVKGLQSAFLHLIRLVQDDKYKSAIPFE